jgi:twitching motility protein PilT
MPYKNYELELENLLASVIEAGASDLHLIPGHSPIIRLDSNLVPMSDREILTVPNVEQIAKIMMTEAQWTKLQQERDLDLSYTFRDSNRFRVNAYYQKNNLALALRYIPKTIHTLEDLSLPASIRGFADRKQGLVLVVGPTGHGKSTTLASLLEYINQTRADHIITIEDPIEYIFTPQKSIIQQREVGTDTASFAQGIRATLREDANVIMIGEMRDLESISAALTVAETGHLVFATLHTNSVSQTIDRIVDSFPGYQQQQIRAQLASVLTGVISLRLVNKIGGGRVAAVEVMASNDAVRNMIRDNKTYELVNVIHTGSKDGMISIDQYLAQMVLKNLVRVEDAKQYVQYPDIFESRLRAGGSFERV